MDMIKEEEYREWELRGWNMKRRRNIERRT